MEHTSWHLISISPFVHAISWTLLHSLWIGAGVSVLAVIGLIATQQSSSVLRYRMLISCLVLFLLATVLAGIFEFQSIYHLPAGIIAGQSTWYPAKLFPGAAVNYEYSSIVGSVNKYSGWIVSFWAILLLLRISRLCFNFRNIHRLRSAATPVTTGGWQDILTNLSYRLQIPGKIMLLESVKISVPVTLGHFSPVIIVPVGFLLQLPYAQVEAVLFHELAHIQRKDYLVNFLQHIVDALFFFNPGLVWISSLIREQREICCDDFVLSHTNKKSDYLKSLLAFEPAKNNTKGSPLVLGIKGSSVARRLARMIENRNQPLNLVPKAIVFSTLLVLPLLAGLFISAGEDTAPNSGIETGKPAVYNGSISTPHKPGRKVADKQPQSLTIAKQKPVKKQLPAGPVALKETSLPDTTFHLASIRFEKSNEDMANRVMNVRDGEGNTYHLKISQNKLVALSINGTVVPESELDAHLLLLARIDHAWNMARARKQEFFAQSTASPEERL